MIFGKINNNKSTQYLPKIAQQLITHLKTLDIPNVEDGRYEVPGIDSDTCYYLVSRYDTLPPEVKQPEMHKKYADLQIIIKGTEMVKCAFYTEDLAISNDYDKERDIMFFNYPNNKIQSSIILDENSFLFLHPNKDLHTPGLNVDGKICSVLKVVGKIKI